MDKDDDSNKDDQHHPLTPHETVHWSQSEDHPNRKVNRTPTPSPTSPLLGPAADHLIRSVEIPRSNHTNHPDLHTEPSREPPPATASESSPQQLRTQNLDDHTEKASAGTEPETASSNASVSSASLPSIQFPTFNDLLFDLLFASVLTVYSSAISFSKAGQIFGFIGFFSLLWWAWWSQTLFDVRFRGPDPDRPWWLRSAQYIVRIALLGAWIAFSATPSEFVRRAFTNFSAIYTITRACLLLDHLLIFLQPVSRRSRPSTIALVANMVACFVSGLLWVLSRFYDVDLEVGWQQLVMWCCGIATELIVQLLVECKQVFCPLGSTVLVERMATFGLIVLGEGFNGLGTVINSLSPGSKNWDNFGIPSGGWGGYTLLNVISSLLVILMQFNAYFRDAVRELQLSSAFNMLLWCYAHLILHLSSAVTVLGLKKVVAFSNAVSALDSFISYPADYLPSTEPWSNITSDDLQVLIDSNTTNIDPVSTPGTLLSIVSIIRSVSGADIPDLEQANALSAAGRAIENISFNSPMRISLQPFFDLADATNNLNPASLDTWMVQNLFHFKYLYGACAIFLASEVFVKLVRGYATRSLKKAAPSLIYRFAFAVILSIIQLIYAIYQGAPSEAALAGALPILAGVLVAEWLGSLAISMYFTWRAERQTQSQPS